MINAFLWLFYLPLMVGMHWQMFILFMIGHTVGWILARRRYRQREVVVKPSGSPIVFKWMV